ncbi:CCHC-type domain-containing protein, partial [Trichostrongylus colubriformis]
MRALTELKNLKIRPGQEVSEFCVALEKIGEQAKPESSPEDRSMEYAQILLENLSAWPEHFQLVGALHKVEPHEAYEETKQSALSIEQSKIMLGTNRRNPVGWKARYAPYQSNRELKQPESKIENLVNMERLEELRETQRKGETHRPKGLKGPSTLGNPDHDRETAQGKKCYHCSKFGHFARECPSRTVKVNRTVQKKNLGDKGDAKVSSMVKQCRSLGMATRERASEKIDLIGRQIMIALDLLEDRCKALVDTGSMISIIPIE